MKGKRYETEKISTSFKGKQYSKSGEFKIGNNQKEGNTSRTLADEYGVGKNTILRNADFSKVIDALPTDARDKVLTGDETIRTLDASTILKFDPPTQKKFLKEVGGGTPIKEAVKKIDPEQKRKENDERIRAQIEHERDPPE